MPSETHVQSTRRVLKSQSRQELPTHRESNVVDAAIGDLHEASMKAFEALNRANDPPTLFSKNGFIVRVKIDANGVPAIECLSVKDLRYELVKRVKYQVRGGNGRRIVPEAARVPTDVCENMHSFPEPPLPRLRCIVDRPILHCDLSVTSQDGYDVRSQAYVHLSPDIKPVKMADVVSASRAQEARALLEDLIADFPFVTQAERANALAIIITLLIRELVDGPVPLFVVESSIAGTGKTLLISVLLYIVCGERFQMMSEARNEDEWRKRLTSILMNGASAVVFDNIRSGIDSAALASALTGRTYSDRVLNRSEIIKLPVNTTFCVTANNPKLTTEIARRAVRIRLDACMERPWQGRSFARSDLMGYVKEHRAVLFAAAMDLVRYGLSAEHPPLSPELPILGSFENWCMAIHRIFRSVGIKGFLGNVEDLYQHSDEETASLVAFVEEWKNLPQQPLSSRELLETAQLTGFFVADDDSRSSHIRLGKLLASYRDRVVCDRVITRSENTHDKTARWSLKPVKK